MTTLVLIAAIVSSVAIAINWLIAESRIKKLKAEREELKRELSITEYRLNVKKEIARKQHLEIFQAHKKNRDLTEKLQKSYYRDKKGRIRRYQSA
jgi:phosphoribulokinase